MYGSNEDTDDFYLFVKNVMLGGCHNMLLYPLNGGCNHGSTQVWVITEAFPIPASVGTSTERTAHRSKLPVNAFVVHFQAHGLASGVRESAIPSRPDIDTSRKYANVVGMSITDWTILKADPFQAKLKQTQGGTKYSYL